MFMNSEGLIDKEVAADLAPANCLSNGVINHREAGSEERPVSAALNFNAAWGRAEPGRASDVQETGAAVHCCGQLVIAARYSCTVYPRDQCNSPRSSPANSCPSALQDDE